MHTHGDVDDENEDTLVDTGRKQEKKLASFLKDENDNKSHLFTCAKPTTTIFFSSGTVQCIYSSRYPFTNNENYMDREGSKVEH